MCVWWVTPVVSGWVNAIVFIVMVDAFLGHYQKDVLNRSKEGEPHHHHETHGRSDDIDKSTPVDEVKGPNVFERVKEEVEAIVGAILPKKDHDNNKN
ncbi:hypothetical protein RJ641_024009 [Dillenia turbinata]|uniref:Uncharacterized protein n=1 Tax=Dillenia turbinata TaxID=194707 RepID=A0AAN8UHM3_9MAGN